MSSKITRLYVSKAEIRRKSVKSEVMRADRVAVKGSDPKHVYKCTKAPRSMSSRGLRFGFASFVTDCSGPRHKCYVPRSHSGFPSCPHIFTFPSSISSQFAPLAFRSLLHEPCDPRIPLTAFPYPTCTLRCNGLFLLPLSSTCKWF
jgi:hypothetical protein